MERQFNYKRTDMELSRSLHIYAISPNRQEPIIEFSEQNKTIKVDTPFYQTNDLKKLSDLLNGIEHVYKSFNSVNSKGFVNSDTVFPFVDDFIKKFNEKDKIQSFSFRSRYWVYSYITIEIYLLTVRIIKHLESISESFINCKDFEDLVADFNVIERCLYTSLDPVIRRVIQIRGVTITKNIYVGFDTEFDLENEKNFINKLVSYQIALNHRLYIHVPEVMDFEFGKIDASSSVFRKEKCENEFIKGVEMGIRKVCKDIRNEKALESDSFLSKLNNHFEERKVEYVTKYNTRIYGLNHSEVCTYIGFNEDGKGVSFNDILIKIQDLDKSSHTDTAVLGDFLRDEGVTTRRGDHSLPFNKRMQRVSFYYRNTRVFFTIRVNMYINIHLSKSDLGILNDFSTLKHELAIVNKQFVTISPLKRDSFNVHIRDTMLLTPASSNSLAAIGDMYGSGFEKVKIPQDYYSNMQKFLKDDYELFKKYALRDAVITLKHVNELERFCFLNIHKMGVPLTLASIGKDYVLKCWDDSNYTYQFTGLVKMGDPGQLFTPKGLDSTKSLGINIAMFIANYKGGRNESFMYGTDLHTMWYDYDLTSAYTTCMAFLGDPDYERFCKMSKEEIERLSTETILNGYLIVKATFVFPENVKFPSIPCYVDNTTTVYPLEGEGYLTGFEYITALEQGCEIEISEGVYIPFKICDDEKQVQENRNVKNFLGKDLRGEDIYYNRSLFKQQPFFNIIKTVQLLRGEHPKGSLSNNLWKNIGNSIYGNTVSGMADKKAFDIKSGEMVRIKASYLTNPVIASYTTSLTRALLSEFLHNIDKLGGRVVSATTDGFITDIPDLETKTMSLENGNILLKIFSTLRGDLTNGKDKTVLELKKVNKGILSWTTRGQLGLVNLNESNKGGVIKAATGFQSGGVSHSTMVSEFIKAFESDDKKLTFIQSSLRSSKDIYLKGGHSVMIYKDQDFRLVYDNRRMIKEPDNNLPGLDLDLIGDTLLDSSPLKDKETCKELRSLATFNRTIYDKNTHVIRKASYKTNLETGVRSFIKGYLSDPPMFGLQKTDFKGYSDIIDFVKSFKEFSSISLSKQSISNLKNRRMVIKNVPFIDINKRFVDHVKKRFPHFSSDDFFKVQ